MRKVVLFFALIMSSLTNYAQKIDFNYSKDDYKLSEEIKLLAKHDSVRYTNKTDKGDYYDQLFRMQLLSKEYKNSLKSLNLLREFYVEQYNEDLVKVFGVQYEAYARAKINKSKTNDSFVRTYGKILDSIYSNLSETNKEQAYSYFNIDLDNTRDNYNKFIATLKDKKQLTVEEAKELCLKRLNYIVYSNINSQSKKYFKTKEDELYIINKEIDIITKDGNSLSALVVQPKKIKTPLPAILQYNIYADKASDLVYAKIAAKNGYVGIVVNTRGKNRSPQKIEPFVNDSNDGYEILDWIIKQPWSNKEVGMYGGSYLGFSQWSMVKKPHPALKTIVPQVSVGIGIDYPMQGNVFMSYMLRWIHYVENNKFTDFNDFGNEKKWNELFKKWFKSGKSFRKLDSLDNRPNDTFQKWLDHPSYDKFWQRMIPYKQEFSNIDIPILTITGYYDADQLGALHYLQNHYKYHKKPNHHLVIGPYSHYSGQSKSGKTLKNYTLDDAAKLNADKLVFEWFNYVFKDSIKPKILKDKINYQLMGDNSWRNVSDFKSVNNSSKKLFLNVQKQKNRYYKLDSTKPSKLASIDFVVDFLNRKKTYKSVDFEKLSIIAKKIDKNNGLIFMSEAVKRDFLYAGKFSGILSFKTNKKDFDFNVIVYELTKKGEYFHLSSNLQRASYAYNRENRKLLTPNKKSSVPINNSFFVSKKIEKGSKIVVVLNINKNPDWQLNYGSGKDVSDETIEDGKIPLKIQWYNDSYIALPILN